MKARYLRPARRELHEAIEYYEQQRPGLGREFRDEVYVTVDRIKALPAAWRPMSSNASDRGRTNAEITHLIEEKDTQDPVLRDYSQVLAVKVHSTQKGKTPLGFSLTFGDSDPRAQGFQKINLTPVSCTLLDAKDLREQASLTDYRSTLSSQLHQGTIYAKDIQVACHTLLAKLGVDHNMSEQDLPARSRLSKGSQEKGTGSNKSSTEETIARSRPSMESAKSEETVERSSDSQGRKQIKILNQGNTLILEFGHNRRY